MRYTILFSILFIVLSCQEDEKAQARRMAAADEIRNRQIKRVTNLQLEAWVMDKGQTISRLLQKHLNRAVNQALEDSTIQDFKDFTQLGLLSGEDSLQQAYKIDIAKLSFSEKLPKTSSELVQQMWTKYKEGEISPVPQSQIMDAEKVLFTSPIILNGKPRGMWRIVFDKKESINMIDVRELE